MTEATTTLTRAALSPRAWSGVDAWRLDGLDDGERNVAPILEGKW